MPENTSTPHISSDSPFAPVTQRLTAEFDGVHPAETVLRCVNSACHGAQDVTGNATPDRVERIARQHLQVLALALSEQH